MVINLQLKWRKLGKFHEIKELHSTRENDEPGSKILVIEVGHVVDTSQLRDEGRESRQNTVPLCLLEKYVPLYSIEI